MSTMALALRDSTTMVRRNVRRNLRYPVAASVAIGTPVVLLLLFVGVMGETLGAGLVGVDGGRGDYLDYIVPGILLISIAGAAQGVAIAVAMDMSGGIIHRFRTMAIARSSVLAGHVLGNLLVTMVALVVVLMAAIALGHRPTATPVEWLAVTGLLAGVSTAIIWLSVALGLVGRSVESASNLPMPLLLLPFLGSGFVPTDTMPAGMGWFAEHQPFTPIIETVRGLLAGAPIGADGPVAVAWVVVLGILGFVWATRLYERDPQP